MKLCCHGAVCAFGGSRRQCSSSQRFFDIQYAPGSLPNVRFLPNRLGLRFQMRFTIQVPPRAASLSRARLICLSVNFKRNFMPYHFLGVSPAVSSSSMSPTCAASGPVQPASVSRASFFQDCQGISRSTCLPSLLTRCFMAEIPVCPQLMAAIPSPSISLHLTLVHGGIASHLSSRGTATAGHIAFRVSHTPIRIV